MIVGRGKGKGVMEALWRFCFPGKHLGKSVVISIKKRDYDRFFVKKLP